MSVEPMGFEPIWNAIKGWDIQREHGAGYHGPTGDDVRHILSALSAAGYAVVPKEPTREMILAAPGRAQQGTEESMYHGIYRAMLAASEPTR